MTPEELAKARKSLGLSQRILAQCLGVTRMTVWRWEHGAAAIPPLLSLALETVANRINQGMKP